MNNNLENIIKLLNAGYSKEDIDALTSTEAKPDEAEEVKPDEAEEVKLDEAKAEQPKAEQPKDDEAIIKRLDKLEKMLQKNAILSDSTDGAKHETTKDILASIINPYLDKE